VQFVTNFGQLMAFFGLAFANDVSGRGMAKDLYSQASLHSLVCFRQGASPISFFKGSGAE
jgi:hypothetical protein